MARRKAKNGEKSPWEQCLTRPVPNGRRRSGFWLVPEKHKFSGTNQKPERRRPFGTGLVRHCPQGLFSPFFTFLRAIYFSARLDFSSSPLSAPRSPRMLLSPSLKRNGIIYNHGLNRVANRFGILKFLLAYNNNKIISENIGKSYFSHFVHWNLAPGSWLLAPGSWLLTPDRMFPYGGQPLLKNAGSS